jgi:hypothetical protein
VIHVFFLSSMQNDANGKDKPGQDVKPDNSGVKNG